MDTIKCEVIKIVGEARQSSKGHWYLDVIVDCYGCEKYTTEVGSLDYIKSITVGSVVNV